MVVTQKDVQKGITVANPLKIDAELDQIFQSIDFADPSVAQQFGNFDANVIPVTTPNTANLEFGVQHNLSRTPIGCFTVLPLSMNAVQGGFVAIPRLIKSRSPDKTYIYLYSPDLLYSFGLVVW